MAPIMMPKTVPVGTVNLAILRANSRSPRRNERKSRTLIPRRYRPSVGASQNRA